MASRTPARLTFSCAASSRSGGSRSPTTSPPRHDLILDRLDDQLMRAAPCPPGATSRPHRRPVPPAVRFPSSPISALDHCPVASTASSYSVLAQPWSRASPGCLLSSPGGPTLTIFFYGLTTERSPRIAPPDSRDTTSTRCSAATPLRSVGGPDVAPRTRTAGGQPAVVLDDRDPAANDDLPHPGRAALEGALGGAGAGRARRRDPGRRGRVRHAGAPGGAVRHPGVRLRQFPDHVDRPQRDLALRSPTVRSGRFEDLRLVINAISDDPRVQAIIIAFCFGCSRRSPASGRPSRSPASC